MISRRALLIESIRRARLKGLSAERLCFGPQLAFVSDQAKYRVAVCSRRAGKTRACSVMLLQRALERPGTRHLYVTLNRSTAKEIIWDMLKEYAREFSIPGTFNESDLNFRLASGSTILLRGAKDSHEIEKLRGQPLRTIVVDEAQAFRPYLRQLIDDVLIPSTWDVDGSISLIGTPSPVPAGPFYDYWMSSEWSHHRWTIRDNPWILAKTGRTPDEILASERARRGVSEDDPSYQREAEGKWVRDDGARVFKYDPERNGERPSSDGQWLYVIGIDLGTDDADAIAVLGWRRGHHGLYLVDEHVRRGATITDLMHTITAMRDKYRPVRMVADTGGLGKKVVLELRKRYALQIEAADKVRKLEHIALLNDDLRTGKFHADKSSVFAQDSMLVSWEPTAVGAKISPSYHSDICDAVLYAHRAAWHFAERAEPEPPAEEDVMRHYAEMQSYDDDSIV